MSSILCYIYPDMADFEVVLALHRLRNAGQRQIITVAETMAPVVSQSGLQYIPDMTIDQAADIDAEALIIPGGPINNDQNAILPLIRRMDAAEKLLCAICFGPQFLGRAGVLDRHAFTTSCTVKHIASQGGADPFPRGHFVNRRVVRDGHVITAQGHAFVDFAQEICRALRVYATPEQEYSALGCIKEN
jgi:putative intracellular protease/amidase